MITEGAVILTGNEFWQDGGVNPFGITADDEARFVCPQPEAIKGEAFSPVASRRNGRQDSWGENVPLAGRR